MSTTDYALFHCLARCCADLLVGGVGSVRSKHAWRQVYRSLEHGDAKKACLKNHILKQFPSAIEDFGNKFVEMQIKRHEADYDPTLMLTKSAVLQDIDDTETVIAGFQTEPTKDRRAFAAFVLFRHR